MTVLLLILCACTESNSPEYARPSGPMSVGSELESGDNNDTGASDDTGTGGSHDTGGPDTGQDQR